MVNSSLLQNPLLDNSEKALLAIFKQKKIVPEYELKLSEKLENIQLDKYSVSLHKTIQNIEKKLGKNAAIKYLNGYLECNNLSFEDIIKHINK